jgi:hypothetical protein
MNLANRSFKNNQTGEVVKVIDSFENIAILENKTKIDVRRLSNPALFTEQIDPKSFLDTSGAYNSLFEKIKQLPTEGMPYDNTEVQSKVQMMPGETMVTPMSPNGLPADEEPAVYVSSEEDERAELARKYGIQNESGSALERQNQAFAKLLGEDEGEVQKVDIVRDIDTGNVVSSEVVTPVQYQTQVVQAPKVDPYEMFRGIKRSIEFKLDLPLTNKIPKLEFIEMMEDSYDKSIIDFLAEDIAEEIIKNPDVLKESIKEKINEMVYGPKPATKKAVTRKPAAKKATSTSVAKKPVAKKAAVRKKNDPLPIEMGIDLEKIVEDKKARERVKKEKQG